MPYRAAPPARDATTDRLDCVEVIARWGDELLAVAHLRPGERFRVGALAPPEVEDDWVLAEHGADGRAVAHRHPRAEGDAGRALGRGEAHAQTLGEVTLVVRRIRGMAPAARRQVEPRAWGVLAMVGALLAMVVVGAMGLRGATRGRAALDEGEDDRRVLRALSMRWPDTTRVEPRTDTGVTTMPRRAEPPVQAPRSARYLVRTRSEADERTAREQVQRRGIFSALGPAHREWPWDFAPWGCFTRGRRRGRLDGELMTEVSAHSSPRWLNWHVRFSVRVRADGRVDQVELSRGLVHKGEVIRAMSRARLFPTGHDRVSVCYIDPPYGPPD
jgi:hypothetical protein